ncbi:Putative thiazole biosynthetic enzyme [Aquicella siphonis]|uniref:Thiazole biosynthetic enzyme n=1 Tax=Aquicella siphonis TaxID=254247 RepID=A0A5E4PFN9_9COXI|nr:NAD(P)/FAD-dependent oxidoreductase [Aquicella siphonis]VVC75247.1 Putative thiazole biosynthetic enzyme [Aquicella siphonis]
MQTHVVIIGAGPAGLTAAYLLSKDRIPVTVIEADPDYVGGIARTVKYKGYHFDIGGHRFFSKAEEVEALWSEILPDDMLERPRSSRILYRQKFFSYPLRAFEALSKLGWLESSLCVLSYLKVRIRPLGRQKSFADWVTNHFGARLFRIFFKTYTEKVWGMSCDEISADWAAQRIKGLSLFSAIAHALMPGAWLRRRAKPVIKTLIDTFRYPRKGPGMLWEVCTKKILQNDGQVIMGHAVYHCAYDSDEKKWEIRCRDEHGQERALSATHVISSAPLRDLVLNYLSPPPSETLAAAAGGLHYRDFLIVVLILRDQEKFTDNWIYVHDDHVDVARIQNFKSWSPEMVPEPGMCSYGMEYFCSRGDSIWSAPDHELIAKAVREITALGLAEAEDILDGRVVRQLNAYPVYDSQYHDHVATIRQQLETQFPSLYLVGRNGMHKYNNQDHAMMTAMLTVKNIIAGERLYDVWCVNQDAEYIEAGSAAANPLVSGLRRVPSRF